MSKRRRWSDKEINSLAYDYGRLGSQELESKYQRKYSTIRNAAIRYGIKSNRELPTCNNGAKKWTDKEELEFKKDWENRLISSSTLTLKYSRSYESLKNKAKEMNINRNIDVDIKEVANLYLGGESSNSIGNQLGVSQTAILARLKSNDVKIRSGSDATRKYYRNSDFFNKIDSHEKAYWLGFLYADGCVCRNEVRVSLKALDEKHLFKLKDSLGMEASPRFFDSSCNGVKYKAITIGLRDKKLCNDLIKLGCTERKSLTLEFPNENMVPRKFTGSFIAGYFDGDGCISESRDKDRYIISFVGTHSMIEGIKRYLNIPNKISTRKNVFTTAITSKVNILNFIDNIYLNSPINLERKKERAKRCKEYYENKRNRKKA